MSIRLSRNGRRGVRALAAVGSAIGLVVAMAGPSSAGVSASVSLTIRASQCSSSLSWAGANPSASYAANTWPRGTVKFCAWKYKMSDSDPAYDYYLVYSSSDFTRSAGTASLAAPTYQTVTSSRTASGNVYGATKPYTSSQSCNTSFSVGVSAGPFSATVTPSLCSSYSVTRPSYGPTAVSWYGAKAGGINDMQSTYYQKVPQGTVPIFTVDFHRPTYTHVWYANLYWKETAGSAKWTAIL